MSVNLRIVGSRKHRGLGGAQTALTLRLNLRFFNTHYGHF